jgi:hypothetical protein
MLDGRPSLFDLASSFLASLQTSTFQARNSPVGATMSLIKKEVFLARRRINLLPLGPSSQPDSTGYSEDETHPGAKNLDGSRHAGSGKSKD